MTGPVVNLLFLIIFIVMALWLVRLLPPRIIFPAQIFVAVVGIIELLQIFGIVHGLLPVFHPK